MPSPSPSLSRFKALLVKFPSHTDAYLRIGSLYKRLGSHRKGLDYCQRAHKVAPGDPTPLAMTGAMQMALAEERHEPQRVEVAKGAFEKVRLMVAHHLIVLLTRPEWHGSCLDPHPVLSNRSLPALLPEPPLLHPYFRPSSCHSLLRGRPFPSLHPHHHHNPPRSQIQKIDKKYVSDPFANLSLGNLYYTGLHQSGDQYR